MFDYCNSFYFDNFNLLFKILFILGVNKKGIDIFSEFIYLYNATVLHNRFKHPAITLANHFFQIPAFTP